MKKLLFGLAVICAGFGVVIAVVGGITLALNVIPWLLYNHIVVPIFHTPHVGFWTCFGILWLVSIVGRALFGGGNTVVVKGK